MVMVLVSVFAQLAVLYLPSLESFFQIEPLSVVQLVVCISVGLLVFVCLEGAKRIRSR